MRLIDAFKRSDEECSDAPSIPVVFFSGEQTEDGGNIARVLVRKVHGEYVLEEVSDEAHHDGETNLRDLQVYFREHGKLPELVTAKNGMYEEIEIGRSELELPNGDIMPFVKVSIRFIGKHRTGRSRAMKTIK